MPVLKLFTPPTIPGQIAESLARELETHCLQMLRARPETIQIALVPVQMLRGAPMLVEAHYRAQPHRDAQALDAFMTAVDQSVQRHLDLVPRIRCFAVDAAALSALH